MKVFVERGLERRYEDVEVGTRCLVARCGSGRTIFGEFGTITKELKNHLVITTESGTIVKVDDMFNTIGKARKEGYFASLNVERRDNLIQSRVMYWNDKKLCFEFK